MIVYSNDTESYAHELLCVASDHALRLRSDFLAVESYGGEVANVYGIGFDGQEWYIVAVAPNETYAGEVVPFYTEDMETALELFLREETLLSIAG